MGVKLRTDTATRTPVRPDHEPDGTVVPAAALSCGLGADSTAILLRWLAEPATAPCNLDDLIIVTAMTGDEWAITGRLVETHVLPRLAARRVRYAQVARAGPRQADGIAVLDDSRSPARLHLAGAYRLSDELRAAGTIPQLAGSRKCSAKAKGHVIDAFLASVTGGRPFLHVMGYEAGETARTRRDAAYDTSSRTGTYPLIAWGWDRAACEDYIHAQTGLRWPKSACTYCPFALSTPSGRDRVFALYLDEPAAAIRDLTLEHTALALNPRQGLAGRGTLAGLLAATRRHDHLLVRFADHLAAALWQVCEVSRAFRASPAGSSRAGQAARSLRILATGSKSAMHYQLADLVDRAGIPLMTESDGIARAWLRHRRGRYPDAEHFLVTAAGEVTEKEGAGFAAAWKDATAPWMQRHADALRAA